MSAETPIEKAVELRGENQELVLSDQLKSAVAKFGKLSKDYETWVKEVENQIEDDTGFFSKYSKDQAKFVRTAVAEALNKAIGTLFAEAQRGQREYDLSEEVSISSILRQLSEVAKKTLDNDINQVFRDTDAKKLAAAIGTKPDPEVARMATEIFLYGVQCNGEECTPMSFEEKKKAICGENTALIIDDSRLVDNYGRISKDINRQRDRNIQYIASN